MTLLCTLLAVLPAVVSSASCRAVGERCARSPQRAYVPPGNLCCAGSVCEPGADGYGLRCSKPAPATEPATVPATAPAPTGALMVIVGRDYESGALATYARSLPPIYAKYGGKYVGFSTTAEKLEGGEGVKVVIISKWQSVEEAQTFWDSPEYTEAKKLREGLGKFDVLLLPGLPGVI